MHALVVGELLRNSLPSDSAKRAAGIQPSANGHFTRFGKIMIGNPAQCRRRSIE